MVAIFPPPPWRYSIKLKRPLLDLTTVATLLSYILCCIWDVTSPMKEVQIACNSSEVSHVNLVFVTCCCKSRERVPAPRKWDIQQNEGGIPYDFTIVEPNSTVNTLRAYPQC